MLVSETVTGKVDKVQRSIERIKAFEPKEGYWLAFSGGKDSQCIYHLAKMARVKFEAHYCVTTVDPPDLLRFMQQNYPDVIWDFPVGEDGEKTNMFKLLSERTAPPTRQIRYCCSILKERKGDGRLVITGVRWAESPRRRELWGVAELRTTSKKIINNAIDNNPAAKLNNRNSLVFMDDNEETRRMVEQCYIKKRTTINPIIDWEDDDVWEFLNNVVKVPHCSLYDEGYTRLGCVGCPLQMKEGMLRDFEKYPGFKRMYIRAFEAMIRNHPGKIKMANGDQAKPEDGELMFQNWVKWCGHETRSGKEKE